MAFPTNWNEGRTTSNAWSQRHLHIFQTQKSPAVKTKHSWKLQSRIKLLKENYSFVYAELFLLCGLAQHKDRWVLVQGKQWEQTAAWQSLFSTNKALIWLCFSVTLYPNIAGLAPIDHFWYYWRPAPEGYNLSPRLNDNPISWVSFPAQIVPLH